MSGVEIFVLTGLGLIAFPFAIGLIGMSYCAVMEMIGKQEKSLFN